MASANVYVGEMASEPNPKRQKTTQHAYNNEMRGRISEYASLNGQVATMKYFTVVCRYAVPESTVRNFKMFFHAEQAQVKGGGLCC